MIMTASEHVIPENDRADFGPIFTNFPPQVWFKRKKIRPVVYQTFKSTDLLPQHNNAWCGLPCACHSQQIQKTKAFKPTPL